jgi:hypothetical protein
LRADRVAGRSVGRLRLRPLAACAPATVFARPMPSITHEALLVLFRNRPELAPELLRDVLHVALPAYSEVRIESADLTDIDPAEYRADLVVLLVDERRRAERLGKSQ